VNVDLWVPGRPKPAERPRLGRRRKAYTPQATIDAELTVATHYQHNYKGTPPYIGPLYLVVDYNVHGQRIQLLPAPHTSSLRGDIDNYIKTTMDGLQKGQAFANDSQVIGVYAEKWSDDYDLAGMKPVRWG